MAWLSGLTAIAGLMLLAARIVGAIAGKPWARRTRRRGPDFVVPPDLDQTARPQILADGSVACSGCDAVVSFDTMTISEGGYFCPGCARAGR